MSARPTDMGRVQEIYDVVTQTQRQMSAVGMTKDAFLSPVDDAADLMAEGIMNRVFRVTEEAGRVGEDIARVHGFDTAGARGVRNRLAHAYGDVDRELIWDVIENDFPVLLEACRSYCDEEGFELVETAGEDG